MNKYLILLTGLLIFSTCLKSQEKIKLFYNSDWKITKEDKATYYRESEYNLNNFKLDGKVSDYSLLGNLLMEGSYLNGKRNGAFTFYYSNGEIKNKGQYKNNRRDGKWEFYYNNGQLKQVVLFKGRDTIDFKMYDPFTVLEYYNREGNQLLKNGTGTWINDSIQAGMFDTESLKTLKGQFKDSLKHGKWDLIRVDDNKLMHSEHFKKGEFIGAEIYNAKGKYYGITSSEIIDKMPDENNTKLACTEKFALDTTVFPKELLFSDIETIFKAVTGKEHKIQNRVAGYIYGDYNLLEFLAKNTNYPISAFEKKITGKVYVGVVIDSLGNTKDVKLVKGVHEDLDNEAQRVVRLVKNWMPALRDGKAVESTITIPVNFQLIK
ncbi:MAG: TonB family protein [Tenuifilaceae bacterium]|jgi:TonB family protein|nr:TonB family protein [Tenuifilaceae bacterium]